MFAYAPETQPERSQVGHRSLPEFSVATATAGSPFSGMYLPQGARAIQSAAPGSPFSDMYLPPNARAVQSTGQVLTAGPEFQSVHQSVMAAAGTTIAEAGLKGTWARLVKHAAIAAQTVGISVVIAGVQSMEPVTILAGAAIWFTGWLAKDLLRPAESRVTLNLVSA